MSFAGLVILLKKPSLSRGDSIAWRSYLDDILLSFPTPQSSNVTFTWQRCDKSNVIVLYQIWCRSARLRILNWKSKNGITQKENKKRVHFWRTKYLILIHVIAIQYMEAPSIACQIAGLKFREKRYFIFSLLFQWKKKKTNKQKTPFEVFLF